MELLFLLKNYLEEPIWLVSKGKYLNNDIKRIEIRDDRIINKLEKMEHFFTGKTIVDLILKFKEVKDG